MKMVLDNTRVSAAESVWRRKLGTVIADMALSGAIRKLELTNGERVFALWRALNGLTLSVSDALTRLYIDPTRAPPNGYQENNKRKRDTLDKRNKRNKRNKHKRKTTDDFDTDAEIKSKTKAERARLA
jgi:hypothetical protein